MQEKDTMESAAAQNWLCEQPKSQVSRSAKPVSVACHSGQGRGLVKLSN